MNGFLTGKEVCDDGGKGGCLKNCTGSELGFECLGGSITSPSICFHNSVGDTITYINSTAVTTANTVGQVSTGL